MNVYIPVLTETGNVLVDSWSNSLLGILSSGPNQIIIDYLSVDYFFDGSAPFHRGNHKRTRRAFGLVVGQTERSVVRAAAPDVGTGSRSCDSAVETVSYTELF